MNKIINTLEDLGITDVSKVNWYSISRYQKLSEKFIEKYNDRVDW